MIEKSEAKDPDLHQISGISTNTPENHLRTDECVQQDQLSFLVTIQV